MNAILNKFAIALVILTFCVGGAFAQSYPFAQPVNHGAVEDVTLSLHTDANAAGDVLAAPQEVTNMCRVPFGTVELKSLEALDEDDNGQNFDVLFLNATGSIGAESAAFAPTDAVARTIVGHVAVTDYVDATNSQYAVEENLDIVMKCGTTTSLWVAAVSREGTPTYTAEGIRLKLGVIRH